ncbi:S4 domain-containing protein YaaA [Facklamia miroungae]|uniref:S4 domain protein YaaA n=1 Tax=Facklamia miroungae TaxID=120956 RepID=A0A1G7SX82_9LACT|nr:S4 domain-containing protein YaaA [Facklamia miroungae]NKZ29498.1 S4 domain-containing protein YaaA [Facklamia miroungae]SDG27677.1 S4 domain protein YaaA [Facklamia miroungae]
MEHKKVKIESDHVTLGQLLKMVDLISSGGMAKWYLGEFTVYLNEEPENRRGRKIYPGDRIEFVQDALVVDVIGQ